MPNFDNTTQSFFLGDSLSDTGNSFALALGAIPPEMSLEPHYINRLANQEIFENLATQVENLSSELEHRIEIRELDKRSTQANPKGSKCTIDCCSNDSTHWLTRQSKDYCQSDMVCNEHAMIWMQVKDLIQCFSY
ncbi:MAG: hypothetical protein WBM44_27875 [Waterburya sp.]